MAESDRAGAKTSTASSKLTAANCRLAALAERLPPRSVTAPQTMQRTRRNTVAGGEDNRVFAADACQGFMVVPSPIVVP
jgi:hypothetical protein